MPSHGHTKFQTVGTLNQGTTKLDEVTHFNNTQLEGSV